MVSARLKMSREVTANRAIPSVRVKPANEDNRVNIRHPSGIKFRAGVEDSVSWPLDSFTKRRIKDGSVVRVEDAPKDASAEEAKAVAPRVRRASPVASSTPETA